MFDFKKFQSIRGGFRARADSQKNRPDASEIARCAPQHTKCTERNRKNNGLEVGGESFSGQAVTICTEKTVSKRLSEKVFNGASGGQMPLTQTHVLTIPDHHWTLHWIPGWTLGSSWVSSPRERGEPSPDALSPSCLSGSTHLLHVSTKKVLQHFGVTCHSADRAVPCQP